MKIEYVMKEQEVGYSMILTWMWTTINADNTRTQEVKGHFLLSVGYTEFG